MNKTSSLVTQFCIQPHSEGFVKNLLMIGRTDDTNADEITLARLSRLQCHFGIKAILLSVKTHRMKGIIKEGKQAAYAPFSVQNDSLISFMH